MDLLLECYKQWDSVLVSYIDSFDITPYKYQFMFPPSNKFFNLSRIQDMLDKGQYPILSQLSPAITFFLLLSFGRFFLQSFVIKPIAMRAMTLKHVHQEFDTTIEKEFPIYKKVIKDEDIAKVATSLKRSEKDVRSYLKVRKNNQIIDKKVTKFVEASWRFLFFSTFSIVGYFCVLHPQPAPWLLDYNLLWVDYPYHNITDAMKVYYIVELGSYLHQLCWTEISRSDSWQMLAHHFITLALIFLSWMTNWTRVGTAIMVIHDIADVFLELAKVFNYTSQGKGHKWMKPVTDVVFGIFAITFFVTRLMYYPSHIIYSMFAVGAPMFTYGFVGAWVWIFLLCSLQLLHIFWFYLIARMIFKLMTVGIEKDERSDDDEIIEDEDDSKNITHKKKN